MIFDLVQTAKIYVLGSGIEGAMVQPSDINSIKEHKLTRRRVVKTLASGGAGAATIANATVDDVKAANNDQVRISYDVTGEHKKLVPADWYDHLRRARKIRDKMERAHFQKDGVIAVGYSAGEYGGDNPHVLVGLEQSNDKADERRGEIPEYKNDIRIDTYETERGEANCEPEFSNQDDVPGGVSVRGRDFDNSLGTGRNSQQCRVSTGSKSPVGITSGLGTCLHIWDACPSGSTSTNWEHEAEGQRKQLGEIGFVAPKYDFVFISVDSGINPVPKIVHPESPSQWNGQVISGTLTESAISDVDAIDGRGLRMYGTANCRVESNDIHQIGVTMNVGSDFCTSELNECVEWGEHDQASRGDSGALVFTDPIPSQDDKQFGCNVHSGSGQFFLQPDMFGSCGYAIRDDYNAWWG